MRKILSLLCGILISVSAFGQTETATIHFLGAKFQKGAKLGIQVGGKNIGYMTQGLQIDHVQKTLGEVTILTQGYNSIDAIYGTPIQIKMNLEAGKEYWISAKWSAKQHLTIVNPEEVAKLTKNGKKIYSVIDSVEK